VFDELQGKFHPVRGLEVVLDADVARYYHASTRQLNGQVTRRIARFPEDFAFRLSASEAMLLRLEMTADWPGPKGARLRHTPRVFTQSGILMASFALNTPKATEASLAIVRAMIDCADELAIGTDLDSQIAEIERRLSDNPSPLEGVWRLLQEGSRNSDR
jgi:hypothetical protein